MADFETDYLIIGAGAVGMAFADTLLAEDPDCHITMVDKHAKPGGHWNDAYSFVALHQPSAFYGVNSRELGEDRIDDHGPNSGLYPLASGTEVSAYFEQVMNRHFLPSGRVRYFPLSEYKGGAEDGGHTFASVFSGDETQVKVRRKLVDATNYKTSVPATHKRKFSVADNVRITIPGKLPDLWMEGGDIPTTFVILGAGKTAMDTGVWLLEAGVHPDKIIWVRPRDSWLINRRYTQPGSDFFEDVVTSQIAQLDAARDAEDGHAMFAALEVDGHMLRIDPETKPEMFHYATISEGEIALLRQITNVVRQGRVQSIEPGKMLFAGGETAVPGGALYIDCTATAVDFHAYNALKPQFDGDTIILQALHVPLVTFSAALTAFLEVNFDDDATRNALGIPGPLTDTPNTYPVALLTNLMNRMAWAQNDKIRGWLATARLDPSGPTVARLVQEKSPKLAIMGKFQKAAMEAFPSLQRLAAAGKIEHDAA
ncbi:NAD(P)-binding protein [Qipengyuania marisflavi]|uniref:NAD(P)/FAD-dependent oxidoreductase n=1 Tax=Qipengyuania marisflavi TaxID=2486356 RepID=A0A5S3NZZ2_9SPHN|nr:NAD(P)-binding protein [Qipengyuania marisflavi]TMM45839.1 NAD(P)/FAD-dependent oxidoreductase [Qipengyuania marisflavi]